MIVFLQNADINQFKVYDDEAVDANTGTRLQPAMIGYIYPDSANVYHFIPKSDAMFGAVVLSEILNFITKKNYESFSTKPPNILEKQ